MCEKILKQFYNILKLWNKKKYFNFLKFVRISPFYMLPKILSFKKKLSKWTEEKEKHTCQSLHLLVMKKEVFKFLQQKL